MSEKSKQLSNGRVVSRSKQTFMPSQTKNPSSKTLALDHLIQYKKRQMATDGYLKSQPFSFCRQVAGARW